MFCNSQIMTVVICAYRQYWHIIIGYDDEKIYFEYQAMFRNCYIPIKEFEKRWHALDKKEVKRLWIAVWGPKPYNYKKCVKIN